METPRAGLAVPTYRPRGLPGTDPNSTQASSCLLLLQERGVCAQEELGVRWGQGDSSRP